MNFIECCYLPFEWQITEIQKCPNPVFGSKNKFLRALFIMIYVEILAIRFLYPVLKTRFSGNLF